MAVRTEANEVGLRVGRRRLAGEAERLYVVYLDIMLAQRAVEALEVEAAGLAGRAVELDSRLAIDRIALIAGRVDLEFLTFFFCGGIRGQRLIDSRQRRRFA